jgi:hypothetical protein
MLATSGWASVVSAVVSTASAPAVDRFPEMRALVAGAVVHVLATAIEEGWDLS